MTRVPASACGSRQNRGSRRRPKRGSHRSLQNARAGFAFRTGFHRPSSSLRRREPNVKQHTPDRRTVMMDLPWGCINKPRGGDSAYRCLDPDKGLCRGRR